MGSPPIIPVEVWEFPFKGGLVLARPDLQGLFLLNSTSRLIWSKYGQGVSVDSLARQFSVEFGVPMSQVAHDVTATLNDWSHGLLSPNRSSSVELNAEFSASSFRSCFSRNYFLGTKLVCLNISDREFADEVAPRLEHLHSYASNPDITFQVSRIDSQLKLFTDGIFFAEESEVNAARAVLLQELARVSQPNTDWLAILHAGACGTDTECVVMPAESNAGKTTLTAALMYSGLQFLADDSAAIDRQKMRVASMPFALMIREGSWPVLASRFPELASTPVLERSGCNVRFLAPPVSKSNLAAAAKCLLFIEFRPDAETTLDPLTPFESLLRLQKTGFWVAHDRASIGTFLSWIESIPSYQATYSDLAEAMAMVHRLLAN